MARYRKRSRYGKRKRFGKRRGAKSRYRKMRGSRSKLYRSAGNYAMPLGNSASPELKSIDRPLWNFQVTAGSAFGGSIVATNDPNKNLSFTFDGVATAFNYGSLLSFAASSSNSQSDGSGPVLLNGCPAGYAVNNRIGRKIRMRSIQGEMTVFLPATIVPNAGAAITFSANATTGPRARLLVVYDRQSNGVVPYKGDVLAALADSGMGGGAGANTQVPSISSFMNLNNRERFLVVVDKQVEVDGTWKKSTRIKFYKKLNLEVVYNSAVDGSAASIMTGALWCFAISMNAHVAVTTSAANMSTGGTLFAMDGNCRIRFTDV